jgi:hypothetical protein
MANEVRLIDANALKQMFDEREADDVELYGGVHIIECFPADDAKQMVDEMPTVDAVPVVHGRWITLEDKMWNLEQPVIVGWKCSACGVYGHIEHNYCPNCGAKMDGDAE